MRRSDGNSDAQLGGRYWPTAKALRALGCSVPADIPDDEPLVAVTAVVTPPGTAVVA